MWRVVMFLVFASLAAVLFVGLEKNWWLKRREVVTPPERERVVEVRDLRRELELEATVADLRAQLLDSACSAAETPTSDDTAELRARLAGLRRELEAARRVRAILPDVGGGGGDVDYWKGLCGGGCRGRQGMLLENRSELSRTAAVVAP